VANVRRIISAVTQWMFVAKIRAAKELSEALGCVVRHFAVDTGTLHLLEADGILHLEAIEWPVSPSGSRDHSKNFGRQNHQTNCHRKSLMPCSPEQSWQRGFSRKFNSRKLFWFVTSESLRSSIPFRAAADIFFRYHTATVYPIAPAAHGSLETYKREATPDFQDLGPRRIISSGGEHAAGGGNRARLG
jgi:hypothetical protein